MIVVARQSKIVSGVPANGQRVSVEVVKWKV